ncbi:MAG: DUF2189 domain-containing protein [Pseudomonadota bacterium]
MQKQESAPKIRRARLIDVKDALSKGFGDFLSAPLTDLFFASFFVFTGVLMAWITYQTGHTFWLILAALGFPLIGALAALGFYEVSRRREAQEALNLGHVLSVVWEHRAGQLPWLATIIIVTFLFWFFLGHMIFALFLGLSPMTNVFSSFEVFLTTQGVSMLFFGSLVGAVFAIFVFSISVVGMPMILDREVDFMTAMLKSIGTVQEAPAVYLAWGIFIAVTTLVAMVPLFLGLFLVMPVLGHATWHLYKAVSVSDPV